MTAIATIACGRLQLTFDRRGDRVGHTVYLLTQDSTPRLLLRSVEGSADEDWPVSPPLRDCRVESRDAGHGQVALLVGMAGRSHWSASVDAAAGQGQIVFDLACRLKQPAEYLGSTYETSGLPWRADEDNGNVVLKCGDAQVAITAIGASRCALADRVTIEPMALDNKATYPVTVRWSYRLTVEDIATGG